MIVRKKTGAEPYRFAVRDGGPADSARSGSAVGFLYLSMSDLTTDAGSSLLMRVSAGSLTSWGECEAFPLVSTTAFVTAMLHGVCQPAALFSWRVT
jgi:hypothetical protein